MSGMSGQSLRHRVLPTVVPFVLAAALGLGITGGAAPALLAAHTADGPVQTTFSIGTSVKGRPITVVDRAYPGAHTPVVIIGNIHGDERAGLRVVHDLLTRTLPRNVDLYLIRTANPDGVAADRRTNADHVDLNRNFPYRWRSADVGTTQWSGPAALSEPESQALRAFVRKIKPALIVIFHQPLFAVGAQPSTLPVARALAKGMRLPVRNLTCGSACFGSFSSWVNNRTDSVAVTVEFGRTASDPRIRRAARTVLSVGAAL
jgi:murein peptide amidase A